MLSKRAVSVGSVVDALVEKAQSRQIIYLFIYTELGEC